MGLIADRYEIIKGLGYGATGSVELVVDTKTGAQAALKLLRNSGHLGYGSSVDIFKQEFEILKEINHPNIARVYDAGLDQGDFKFYIATEFVPGKDLYNATEGVGFEALEDIFVQILRALNYLHFHHVYHLDIKPRNILVIHENSKFTVKIIDFGYANFFDSQYAKRKKEEDEDNIIIVGSPAYTAPEIITGTGYDGRTDLYSLGCVFYEALTRRLPFRSLKRDPCDVREKHLHELPIPPKDVNQNIPEYLNDIILRLLRKNPNDRFASAEDVIREINFFKEQAYEIETIDTRRSYLLEKSRLIGRDAELKIFREYYKDRILAEKYQKSPFLIITGDRGSGKSRFLSECKYEAQRKFDINIITWDEFNKTLMENLKTPCLVVGDDVPLKKLHISKLVYGYDDAPFLAVLTTNQEDIPCDKKDIIELKYFDEAGVEVYLKNTIGITKIKKEIVDDLYKYTNSGCPLYLVEFLKAAFGDNYLIDKHGKWSDRIFNDMVGKLKTKGFTDFIKDDLKNKVGRLNLNESQLDLMYMMALTDRATLVDIKELTSGHLIKEQLEYFVREGVLKEDPVFGFVFTNPLYKEVFVEQMPQTLKEKYCDRIADHLETQNGDEQRILYFRGRGAGARAPECLLKLARLHMTALEFTDVIENVLEVVNNALATTYLTEALLLLSEVYIELGEINKALEYLNKIISKENNQNNLALARAYEFLGICYYRKERYDKSTVYYNKGIDVLKHEKNKYWKVVSLKNRIVINKIEQGDFKAAEEMSQKAWVLFRDGEQDVDIEPESIDAGEDDVILTNRGEYQKSTEILNQQLLVLKNKKHDDQYARTLYRLAVIKNKLGELEESEKLLHQSLELVRERKTTGWLFSVYNELGVLSEKKKDFKRAAEYYQHSFDLAQKTSLADIDASVVALNLARSFSALGNLDKAKKFFDYIIITITRHEEIKSINKDFILMSAYIEQARILRKEGNVVPCVEILRKAGLLLTGNEHLKHYEQYYLQEVALTSLITQNHLGYEETKRRLELLKKESWFNHMDYTLWNKPGG
ncbi:MAG: tetratricopeptide repeat protein [Deltaproteobacteria bacterium]|nr:tetratricopeptide repeat protein [Deltaproteobacteria bacterium]